MDIKALVNKTHQSAALVAKLPTLAKNGLLQEVATAVRLKLLEIVAVNHADIDAAIINGKDDAFLDRLALDEARLEALAQSVEQMVNLPDPVGAVLEYKTLENGIELSKVRVPIGVLAIIYEARPGVTIEAACLSLKAGNSVILKGGKEAILTNRLLMGILHSVLQRHGLEHAVGFVDSVDRFDTLSLLQQHELIDVVIPRGGYDLVRFVVENSRIPALYHGSGIDHIYVDASANLGMALEVILNSKTSRPATCNSVDTVLVHQAVASELLPQLQAKLEAAGVRLQGDQAVSELTGIELAKASDFDHEWLSLQMNLKVVEALDEAMEFIAQHGSKHTEGIVAQDQGVIDLFTRDVDAAAICVNCSLRLHDGGVFGMGAEMGIATGKLHARGPVGLNELCSYKWVMRGTGQIR